MRHSAKIPLSDVGCEALYLSVGDLYQNSALQGGRTGRRISILTRWRQDFGWLLSAQKPETTLVLLPSVLRDCISVPL